MQELAFWFHNFNCPGCLRQGGGNLLCLGVCVCVCVIELCCTVIISLIKTLPESPATFLIVCSYKENIVPIIIVNAYNWRQACTSFSLMSLYKVPFFMFRNAWPLYTHKFFIKFYNTQSISV